MMSAPRTRVHTHAHEHERAQHNMNEFVPYATRAPWRARTHVEHTTTACVRSSRQMYLQHTNTNKHAHTPQS